MRSLNRRLEALEAKAKPGTDPEHYAFDQFGSRPKEFAYRVYFKLIERQRARADGERPPAFTREEIEHMREEDLETAAGGGTVAEYRNAPGWQDEESQRMLDEWEQASRSRLEQTEDLPREHWYRAYEDDVEEEIDGRSEVAVVIRARAGQGPRAATPGDVSPYDVSC